MSEWVRNPLYVRERDKVLRLFLVGLVAFVVGALLAYRSDLVALAGLLILVGFILLVASFSFSSSFLLFPMGRPKSFRLDAEGIALAAAVTLDGPVEKTIPWSGVVRVVSTPSTLGTTYELVLADWSKALNPLAAQRAARTPGIPLPGQTSRVQLTAAQWAAVASRVPPDKQPR